MTAAADRVGRPGTRGNLRTLVVAQALTGAYVGAYYVILQPMLLSLGMTVGEIGVLMSLAGMGGLISSLVQPIGGVLSDLLGRKPLILTLHALGVASCLGLLAASLARSPEAAVAAVLVSAASFVGSPAWDAAVAESTEPARFGAAFGAVASASTLAGLISSPLSGAAADLLGYPPVLAAAAVLQAAAAAAVWLRYREGLPPARRESLPRILSRVLSPPGRLRGIFAVMAMDSAAWWVVTPILTGMLVDSYGLTNLEVGILSATFSASWAVFQMPAGLLVDRFGPRPVLTISEALGVPLALTLSSKLGFSSLLVAEVILGAAVATWIPSFKSYVISAAGEDDVAGSMGRLNALRGVVGFPSPALGGVLYETWGMTGPLTALALGSVAVAAAAWLLLGPPGD